MKFIFKKLLFFDFNFHIAGIGIGNLYFFSNLCIIMSFIVIHTFSYHKKGIEIFASKLNITTLFMLIFITASAFYFFIPTKEVPFIYFQF